MVQAASRATAPLLRQLNTREVLAALQRHGPLSRADIARHTGISSPTVTRTVTDLLDALLLEEGEAQQPALGRPARVLRLATKGVSVLGLVVGVEQCELVTAGLDGVLHENAGRVFSTPARYGDLLRKIGQHVAEYQAATTTSALGLGISIPGLLSRRDKRTLLSPNLHQTDGHQLGVDVARQTGLETAILHEAYGLCLAERTYGAARGVADFAMMDITDGLGLGVVQGGQFVEGHSGLAGELGHITVDLAGRRCGCGNTGCLETVATDSALAFLVSQRLKRDVSPDELIPLLASGQIDAEPELTRVLEYLSVGLAAVINLFNPQKLFIYGRLFDAGPDVFARLIAGTARRSLAPALADCEIIRAQGNKRLGAVASIIHRLTAGREDVLIQRDRRLPMKISYLETGGFVPRTRGCEIEIDSLSASAGARLRQLIEQSCSESWRDTRIRGSADLPAGTITLETETETRTARFDLPSIPEHLAPLVAYLRERSHDLLSEP